MTPQKKQGKYRFTFGPWNISMGADPFGPPVRKEVPFAAKIREYKKLGFDGVQFHDDDVVEADLDHAATMKGVAKVKKMLEGEGLFCEFIAPRLWEHPKTIDGAYTSNSAAERKYAIERSKRAVDIARAMDCKDIVLWLAREGTYIREAKDPIASSQRILDAVNALLEHDPDIRILAQASGQDRSGRSRSDNHVVGAILRHALIPSTTTLGSLDETWSRPGARVL